LKAVIVLAASGAAVGGLYLGGAFERGEVYNLPIGEARVRLESVALPPSVTGSAGGSGTSLAVDGSSDTFTWTVSAGNDAAATFSAHLLAEGPTRTRVILGYSNGRTQSPWADRLMSTSFMRSYAQSSFHEQVDAALDGRAPDQRQAMQAFAIHAAAHPEEMREVGLATQEIFKDVSNQMEAAKGASGQFGSYGSYSYQPSARERMSAATQPNYQATRPSTQLPSD
jgi:hypothetical protein